MKTSIYRSYKQLIKSYKIFLFTFVIFLLTLPATIKLMRNGFFPMYDDMQVIRVEQMDKCLQDGQIPCRWVPDLGYGYGYPLYDYYAPLPYYFMEAVHLIGFSFIDSVKIGFVASVYIGALFFFLLSRNFFSSFVSFFSTFVFVMLPFRAADVYVRGAMGESWGLAALPLVLWGYEYVVRKQSVKATSVFALTFAIFLLSHNLTVLMTLPLLGVWGAMRLAFITNKKYVTKLLISGLLLGVSSAAFYILPLVYQHDLVHKETLIGGYFNYVNHFSDLKQIFASTHWGFGPSEVGPNDDAFVGIGPLHLLLGMVGFVGYFIIQKNNKNLPFYSSLLTLAVFYAFLMHGRSYLVWANIPFMAYLQFPWRLALPASFLLSFLSALVLVILPNLLKPLVFMLTVLLLVLVYGSYFTPKDWFAITDSQKLSGELRTRQVTASIYDYLPKSAKSAPTGEAPDTLVVKEGEVAQTLLAKGSNWYSYSVEIQSDRATVALPAFDFPDWRIMVDTKVIKYTRNSELGLPTFELTRGKGMVYAQLIKTPVKKVADLVSVAGILTITFLVFFPKFKWKRAL